jgi:hypothetical protein
VSAPAYLVTKPFLIYGQTSNPRKVISASRHSTGQTGRDETLLLQIEEGKVRSAQIKLYRVSGTKTGKAMTI